MADSNLESLTAITAANVADTDLFYIWDIGESGISRSKKITAAELRKLARTDVKIASFASKEASAIATSTATDVPVGIERAYTITRVIIVTDVAGTFSLQLRRNAPSADVWSTPTTIGTSSVASGKNYENDTTLSGYTTSLAAGDVLDVNVSANGASATGYTAQFFGTPA